MVFLNPEIDPMGIGYQIKQAVIAVGSGGILGLGLGMSAQKFGFLPQSMSDSIFAIFAEEAGFLGASILIFLFLLFLWSGFKIGKSSQNKFSQLIIFGITSWIVFQGFVNIGSMIRILPLTGIPLPFISYGGSALISELIGIGILLNISKHQNVK
jgi:cell division protein FtsW